MVRAQFGLVDVQGLSQKPLGVVQLTQVSQDQCQTRPCPSGLCVLRAPGGLQEVQGLQPLLSGLLQEPQSPVAVPQGGAHLGLGDGMGCEP